MRHIELPDQTLLKIGEGAMARVYRAQHPEFGDIAVKVLRQRDPAAWQRLQREAAAQAQLDHPHIGRVFGIGEYEGQPAILMQRVEGRTFDVVAAELPLEARIALLVQVCDAVEHAHAAGLVHRDLKPANVLVEEQHGRLHPYVLDFGLVHDANATSLTAAGELLGTPAYMSPEQARGDARHVDRRSDVYALGSMLFELLTGRTPFQADSVSEMLGHILSDDAPLAHRISASVPLPLSRICAQCLERDPARRYGSAAALRADLQQWLRGQNPAARAVGLRYRSARWLRRNRALGTAFAAIILLLFTAGIWSLHVWRQAALREAAVARMASASEAVRSQMRLLQLAPVADHEASVEALSERLRQLTRRAKEMGGSAAALASQALGEAWLAVGQAQHAIDALDVYLAQQPNDPHALRLRAEAQLTLYQNRIATLSDRSAEQIDDLLDPADIVLRQEAERALETAAMQDPDSPPLARARLALLRHDYPQALVAVSRYRPRDIADYAGTALQAEILAAQAEAAEVGGDLTIARRHSDEAIRAYAEALTIGRSDSRLLEARCRAAAVAMRIDSRDGSRLPASPGEQDVACDQAVQVRPERAQGWSARAIAWSAIAGSDTISGDRDKELSALQAMRDDAQQAALLAPDRPEPALLLGRVKVRIAQMRIGGFDDSLARYDEAIGQLETLRTAYPEYAPLLRELSIAYRQRGRLKVNYEKSAEQDFAHAIEIGELALKRRPDSVSAADELSLTYVFAFYSARVVDPAEARRLGERAIAVLDTVLAQQPGHPDALATQIANLADLWAYLRSLHAEQPPADIAPLRERALRLAEQLRQRAPQRPEGYTAAGMLELTAAEFGHERGLREPLAIRRAIELFGLAQDANVELPAELHAWLAVERAREALASDDSPLPLLEQARSLLQPVLDDRDDVDAWLSAARTALQLSVAEAHWRTQRDDPVDAVVQAGTSILQQMRDSGRDFGAGHCDAGDLLLISAQQQPSAAARREAASAAARELTACVDGAPFAHGYRQPLLEQARALAESE